MMLVLQLLVNSIVGNIECKHKLSALLFSGGHSATLASLVLSRDENVSFMGIAVIHTLTSGDKELTELLMSKEEGG